MNVSTYAKPPFVEYTYDNDTLPAGANFYPPSGTIVSVAELESADLEVLGGKCHTLVDPVTYGCVGMMYCTGVNCTVGAFDAGGVHFKNASGTAAHLSLTGVTLV